MASSARRPYRSALRETQARQTRQAIVSAATVLFTRNGFGPTTIDAIAAEAGVSRKTVFTAVGGKPELLKLALDSAIAGDDEPVAVIERPEAKAMLATTDPAKLLRAWAKILVRIDSRVAMLAHALDIASDRDPDARALRDQLWDQRLEGARRIVRRLVELNALRDGLSSTDAADIAWLHSDPVLHERLVRTRGWSSVRFENWLGDSLIRQLID